MIDCIFNKRLNRQRRDEELRSLYVVFYVKIVVITYFFEGTVFLNQESYEHITKVTHCDGREPILSGNGF